MLNFSQFVTVGAYTRKSAKNPGYIKIVTHAFQQTQSQVTALQQQLARTQQALVALAEVPHLKNSIDYETLGDIETLVEANQEATERLTHTTKDIEILKALEHMRPLLKRLERTVALNQQQLEQTDRKFIKQASTLQVLETASLKLLQ